MTADITVLQQTYNGQPKVLCRATGTDCGDTSIENRFCKMLEGIVGGNVIAKVKRKDTENWLIHLQDFRIQMNSFTPSNMNVIRLRFPILLDEICMELHGKNLKSAIESSSYVNEITVRGDKYIFKADVIIKLFTPTIDSIITLMKNTVSNRSMNGVSNNVSNIVMVGRLSNCFIAQDAVYKAFPDNQIIIPDDNYGIDLSVLEGAVLFGHRPDYNRSELCDEEGIGK